MRSHLDALRPVFGMVFLAAYMWQTFAPGSFGTDLFLGVGTVLFVISVPWSSAFHRAFALVAFMTLCAVIFTGRFDIGDFQQGMPTYFGIVAVLLVLSIAGSKIDFVDLHWYPGGSSAAESLAKPAQLTDALYLVRKQIAEYAGSNAGRIGISLTETNVGVGQNTQPGALYLADTYSALLEQGVFTVHWWDVHNGIGTVTEVAGQTDYGDYGLLSSGNCNADNTVCQPPLNTPFAPYHGLAMMKLFAKPGDQFVRASTGHPPVAPPERETTARHGCTPRSRNQPLL